MRWFWIDKFMEFRSGQFARAIKNLTLALAPQNPVVDEWLGYRAGLYNNKIII